MLLKTVEDLLLHHRHGVHIAGHGLERRLDGVAQPPLPARRLVQVALYGGQPRDLFAALGRQRALARGIGSFPFGNGSFSLGRRTRVSQRATESDHPGEAQRQHQYQHRGRGHDDGLRPRQHL